MSVVTQGLGPSENDPNYVMRAFHISSPVGYVYWTVEAEPDGSGEQAPYPPAELNDIVVLEEVLVAVL